MSHSAMATQKPEMEPDLKPTSVRKLGRRPKFAMSGREVLLDAAYRTFARLGYAGTSLRDAAAQTEVDAALVARLFGSKAKLWEAVVERLWMFVAPTWVKLRPSKPKHPPLSKHPKRTPRLV